MNTNPYFLFLVVSAAIVSSGINSLYHLRRRFSAASLDEPQDSEICNNRETIKKNLCYPYLGRKKCGFSKKSSES